ncbi:hypothetical protein Cni_G20675 [Canna indica]|uniref:Polysaccharide biosynthesis domain-containing protein n=1 Tax=Canna indica TaxID=4628 RepID=A0AAQ3QJY1_9LILI|nr:hypothetical protein Cni_G20675 [Canna indica]
MRTKVHNNASKFKLFLIFFLVLIALYILKSRLSSSPPAQESTSLQSSSAIHQTPSCTKIPLSLASTIIHYATSNVTPQQTLNEISVAARVLQKKSPCNFLVFGLGRDSPMWSALNHGGRTIFLEEDASWIQAVKREFPALDSYHVTYDTKVSEAEELLELRKSEECTMVGDHDMKRSKCPLALRKLPSVFYEVEWDLIMVDAPTGFFAGAPGRMGAIYTAGMAARGRREGETDVFVHDVDRVVEDKFSRSFLCEGYLQEQEGRLRHFVIPSHRTTAGIGFCP